ncbi:MAG: peroxiredoxin [Gammaproteobacteria bacterium]
MAGIGKPFPDFDLAATGGGRRRLSDLAGRPVVVYFYPKDSTPGCTQESRDFRDLSVEFERHGAAIVGISRDAIRSHERFKEAECLPFELLSDADEALCRELHVLKEKNLYGKKVMGIERSTFLIDARGVLRREWRKVKVDGHAAEVLEAVQRL